MKILSISTATKNLSVAVNEASQILVEKNTLDQRNHSVNLMPTIQAVLNEANLELAEIDCIAVAQGPGSYTGLRIGATTAKILADLLKQNLIGISTLAALSEHVKAENSLLVPILDARNDNFFAGLYRANDQGVEPVIADQHIHLDHLIELIKENNLPAEKIIFVGEFKPEHELHLTESLADKEVLFSQGDDNLVHAGAIGHLAQFEPPVNIEEFVPKYLRLTQAEVDWEKKTGQSSLINDRDYVEEV